MVQLAVGVMMLALLGHQLVHMPVGLRALWLCRPRWRIIASVDGWCWSVISRLEARCVVPAVG